MFPKAQEVKEPYFSSWIGDEGVPSKRRETLTRRHTQHDPNSQQHRYEIRKSIKNILPALWHMAADRRAALRKRSSTVGWC